MIAIIDYGMGNLHSVSKAVERLGYEARLTADAREILEADGVILPGVGAFGDAMHNLTELDLPDVIRQYAQGRKPLLGICLGMQLLFTESEEHGRNQGLDLMPGRVVRFQGKFKIPHMGWNRLVYHREAPIFGGLEEGHVYFVHSFHVQVDKAEDLLASTDYHGKVTAIVGRDNVYGMQFHPEKSGATGMKLLDNFLKLTKNGG
ncbi:imidazole glycerol phosphate synthase subunit HisH [Xylanibacillus composti]|uniref:Imidazole glycerol phosphate synthase subunit HisH n=1 Tax=Xylanibacillus composti TaxID=1572762 RepID=A0A8J4GYH0_9BACL|nr:imidazole glycerol phosphate synthase subunit HisH [Xylanibacillus composti]MDT9725066.1 imidazole glycerol phosphate synthase subunit HisH [Xylanibacillus composti]GIQ67454.1 imidazole glycerol phosphate synthase subunit HisH [Xylanibacillus composti]